MIFILMITMKRLPILRRHLYRFSSWCFSGAKWVTQRGFVAEIYAGIGRDMFNQSEIEVVGRGGMSIGYRFQ